MLISEMNFLFGNIICYSLDGIYSCNSFADAAITYFPDVTANFCDLRNSLLLENRLKNYVNTELCNLLFVSAYRANANGSNKHRYSTLFFP